jgi:hypothetical protein
MSQYGIVGKLIFVEGRGRNEDGTKREDRYQIVDRPGFYDRDITIHNGDIIKVKRGERWIELQARSDGERWSFYTAKGTKITWNPREFPCKLREA